ncbi:MAG: hypothetical protein AAFR61_25845 [Bacteroidota bacterium]
MKQDLHQTAIEQLLQQIPLIERNVWAQQSEQDRERWEKRLRQKEKRFERLIPYSFRRQLKNLCLEVGVSGEFS